MKQSEARALIQAKITVDDNGCWLWPGESPGYGTAYINGKWYGAHRLSYLAHRGRIGKLQVLHTCDVPKCVNPDHLFLGTHDDNMADLVAKDRGSRELANNNGKFTDEQIREIRTKRARGVPASWIAEQYGTSAAYVRDIVNGRLKHGHPTRHHAMRAVRTAHS